MSKPPNTAEAVVPSASEIQIFLDAIGKLESFEAGMRVVRGYGAFRGSELPIHEYKVVVAWLRALSAAPPASDDFDSFGYHKSHKSLLYKDESEVATLCKDCGLEGVFLSKPCTPKPPASDSTCHCGRSERHTKTASCYPASDGIAEIQKRHEQEEQHLTSSWALWLEDKRQLHKDRATLLHALSASQAECGRQANLAKLALRVFDELFATVRGECPSLLEEDSGGSAVLAEMMIELRNARAALGQPPK